MKSHNKIKMAMLMEKHHYKICILVWDILIWILNPTNTTWKTQ